MVRTAKHRRGRLPCSVRLLLLLLAGVVFGLGSAQRAPIGTLYGPTEVLAVIDGDTLILDSSLGPRAVRLIGIDAPEMRRPEGGAEAFGIEASAFVSELLPPGTPVWVETDLVLSDAYGRLLGYVYLEAPHGAWWVEDRPATQVNLAVAEAGLARLMTVEPNSSYADLFVAAVAAAQSAGRGMWSGSSPGTADWPRGPIIVWCALYNPSTPNDEDGEWVSVLIRVPLDTRGYYLYDAGSGARFRLPPGVQPPGELRIRNPGRGVWNNGGDTIYLMLGGEVVDAWDYTPHVTRVEDTIVCRDGRHRPPGSGS